jgi:hypothetical protein
MPFGSKRKYSTTTRVNYKNSGIGAKLDTSSRSVNVNPLNKRRNGAGFKTPNSLHHKKAINPLMSGEKILNQTPISEARSRSVNEIKLENTSSGTKTQPKESSRGDYSSPSKNMNKVNSSNKNPNFMSAVSEYNMAIISSSKLKLEDVKFSSKKKDKKRSNKWTNKKQNIQIETMEDGHSIPTPQLGHF